MDFSPGHTALLRNGSALVFFVAFFIIVRGTGKLKHIQFFARPSTVKDGWMFFFFGALSFAGAPLLQAFGLNFSQATDNALIVALEPLLTVLVAWIFLKERLHRSQVISFLIAMTGFSFLSRITWQSIISLDPHLIGNLFILLSLCGEAAFSSFTRKLLPRFPPTAIFGTGLAIGLVFIFTITLLRVGPIPLENFTTRSFLAVLWMGPLGTTTAYLVWTIILSRTVPIAAMALTLFLQPVLGSIWGYLFLNETLETVQLLGAALILVAIFLHSRRRLNG